MAKKFDIEEIKPKMRELVAEIAELEPEEVRDEASFSEDLGVDSMMALEIVAKIEKMYKVVIPEEKIPEIRSLQNVYSLLETLLNK